MTKTPAAAPPEPPAKSRWPRRWARLQVVAVGAAFVACLFLAAMLLFDLVLEAIAGRFAWLRLFLVLACAAGAAGLYIVVRRTAIRLRPFFPKIKRHRRNKRPGPRSARRKRR